MNLEDKTNTKSQQQECFNMYPLYEYFRSVASPCDLIELLKDIRDRYTVVALVSLDDREGNYVNGKQMVDDLYVLKELQEVLEKCNPILPDHN